MSNRNGDKSRHHRQRKEKIRRRATFAALSTAGAEKDKPVKPARKAAR